MDLNRAVQYLAQARKEVAGRKAEIEMAQDALESTKEWTHLASLKASQEAALQAEAEAVTGLRELAMSAYNYSEGRDKHPHAAITIKEYELLGYDPEQAKSYAIAHLPNALKLDAKAFEKAAKVLDLDFVTIGEEPRASIASDLSEWEK